MNEQGVYSVFHDWLQKYTHKTQFKMNQEGIDALKDLSRRMIQDLIAIAKVYDHELTKQ